MSNEKLFDKAAAAYNEGDLDSSLALFEECAEACRQLGKLEEASIALLNQGNILCDKREYDKAMEKYKQQEEICRWKGLTFRLAQCLLYQSTCIYDRKMEECGLLDPGYATPLREAKRLCEEHGYSDLGEEVQRFIEEVNPVSKKI